MTATELTILLIAACVTATVVALVYARQEHADAAHQRRRADRLSREAEEYLCWSDEYQRKAGELARRNLDLAERNRALQALYALRTRQLLAKNFGIIAANLEWKRRTQ